MFAVLLTRFPDSFNQNGLVLLRDWWCVRDFHDSPSFIEVNRKLDEINSPRFRALVVLHDGGVDGAHEGGHIVVVHRYRYRDDTIAQVGRGSLKTHKRELRFPPAYWQTQYCRRNRIWSPNFKSR
jgi:hypothetical protein